MNKTYKNRSALLLIPAALLAFWSLVAESANTDAGQIEVATSAAIVGSELKKITLIQSAVERLDIQFGEIKMTASGQLTVPYSALWYDLQGKTWVFVNPQLRVFMRDPVEVESISAGLAFLTAGPAVGTKVVVIGVAELHGIESGVGH